MKNLNELLTSKVEDNKCAIEEKKPEEANLCSLDTLFITNYAFEKAYAYAKIACKIAGISGTECGGYLIALADSKDNVATDAILAKKQDVSDGTYRIEPIDVIRSGKEIEAKGYRVLGWWHSHGFLRTFFSAIDDAGQMAVLNAISSSNYASTKVEREFNNLETKVEEGKIVLYDKDNRARRFELGIKSKKEKVKISSLKITQEKRTSFAYGLVVNADDKNKKPYAEIASRDICSYCVKPEEKSISVRIMVVESAPFIYDEKKVEAELKERLVIRPSVFKVVGSIFKWGQTKNNDKKGDETKKDEKKADSSQKGDGKAIEDAKDEKKDSGTIKIEIPGLNLNVKELSDEEKKMLAASGFSKPNEEPGMVDLKAEGQKKEEGMMPDGGQDTAQIKDAEGKPLPGEEAKQK